MSNYQRTLDKSAPNNRTKVTSYSPTTGRHLTSYKQRAIITGNKAKGFELYADESHLFHILLVKIENDQKNKRYVRNESTQCYSIQEWNAMLKDVAFKLEYDEVEILHDPTLKGAVVDEEDFYVEEKKKAKKATQEQLPIE